MKKFLPLVLALTTLALVGCGGGADNSSIQPVMDGKSACSK